MKKKVIIIAVYPETMNFYYNTLKNIFEDYIDIEIITLKDNDNTKEINGDIILYTIPFMEPYAREKCTNPNAVYLNMGLVLDGQNLDKLKSIKKGTDVLLLSILSMFLWEIKENLRHYGVNNINLIPYYGQNMDVKNINYAVYMGLKYFDFPHIENYIDIGWRIIHPAVIRKIGELADINRAFVDRKIKEYVVDEEKTLDYSSCLSISMNSEFIQERNTILDMFNYPVIMLDLQLNIISANESFIEEFKIDLETLLGNKIYTNKILTDIYTTIQNNRGIGIYTNKNGRKYKVIRRIVESIKTNPNFRQIIEIHPIVDEHNENRATYSFKDIIFSSEKMSKAISMAKKVALIDATVLINGESGTGKELIAHSIHEASLRCDKPFIAVNCGAFPENLLESELFGYAPGSFTGASKIGKKGLLEIAHGGTVFLDEIGDASLKTQVRLLRFLQEKEIQPIGSNITKKIDVRVICATNIDIEKSIEEGKIRKDLYYRISPITINLPPLRERKEDIEPLLYSFMNTPAKISSELKNFLFNYSWPGNARELRGCAEYLSYFGGDELDIIHLPEKYQDKYEEMKKIIVVKIGSKEDLKYKVLQKLSKKSLGRRGLVKELREEGFYVTEHEIKNILCYLKEEGLIIINQGRKATNITEKGKNILRY